MKNGVMVKERKKPKDQKKNPEKRRNRQMIEGVMIRDLVMHADEHGYLYEVLREDWPEYKRFGQVYVTVTYPGIIKGWHYHDLQTDHFCVIRGMAKIVLYDGRANSPTQHELMEVVMGEFKQSLLIIPHHVLHGVIALNNEPAWILNIPDVKYDYGNPDEQRMPYDKMLKRKDGSVKPYTWFRTTETEGLK